MSKINTFVADHSSKSYHHDHPFVCSNQSSNDIMTGSIIKDDNLTTDTCLHICLIEKRTLFAGYFEDGNKVLKVMCYYAHTTFFVIFSLCNKLFLLMK